MAYPPSTIASDKTNSTLSESDHPPHHNALAAAVNDIVAELGTNPSGGVATVTGRLSTVDTDLALIDQGSPSASTRSVRVRRGTAAQWSSSNPVLPVGEAGFVTDKGILKIGDGATAWNSLTSQFEIGPHSMSGLLAARPAANAVLAGTLYFATDDRGGTIWRSTGAAWEQAAASMNTVASGTVLASAVNETALTGVTSTTGVDIPGLVITGLVIPASYPACEVVLSCPYNYANTIGIGGVLLITDAADVSKGAGAFVSGTANQVIPFHQVLEVIPAGGGTFSRKARVKRLGASGNVNLFAGASAGDTYRQYLQIRVQ